MSWQGSTMYTDEELNEIYDSTNGYCRYCGIKVYFTNHGSPKERGAWEVDHVNPVVSRGSDNYHNLVPACVRCNRSKGGNTLLQWCRRLKNSNYSEDFQLWEKIIENFWYKRDDIADVVHQVRDE